MKISEETYKNVARMIKEENPNWGGIDDEILILFLKLACMRFRSEDFEGYPEEELKKRIRNAFNSSPEARSITPDKIAQLNSAYRMGKQHGLKIHHFVKAIFKKVKKEKSLDSKLLDS